MLTDQQLEMVERAALASVPAGDREAVILNAVLELIAEVRELRQAGGEVCMITEAELERLGFNKIVWNDVVPEYWLPLLEEKGDYRDIECRLGVRFNEYKGNPGPCVWLVVGSMVKLPHIVEVNQLIQLYELLSGRKLPHTVLQEEDDMRLIVPTSKGVVNES